MGFLSRFEGKMEDTVEGAAERMGSSPLSPVQIAKKAEKQMRREKMVGAGKQYAPTLYTVLVSEDDDARMFGYYPTLAGETETYLAAKAAEHGLLMDGHPLVRFIADAGLKHGKFEVVAEMVAAPLVAQLRDEEMERYGLAAPQLARGGARAAAMGGAAAVGGAAAMAGGAAAAPGDDYYGEEPRTMMFDRQQPGRGAPAAPARSLEAYLYDAAHDKAFTLTGRPMSIGRESGNDIVISDINVSRAHAEIRMEPSGEWVIADLGSTNGTYVNGRPAQSALLRDADRILIGTTELEFQLI